LEKNDGLSADRGGGGAFSGWAGRNKGRVILVPRSKIAKPILKKLGTRGDSPRKKV